jgi:hypothetical protein
MTETHKRLTDFYKNDLNPNKRLNFTTQIGNLPGRNTLESTNSRT